MGKYLAQLVINPISVEGTAPEADIAMWRQRVRGKAFKAQCCGNIEVILEDSSEPSLRLVSSQRKSASASFRQKYQATVGPERGVHSSAPDGCNPPTQPNTSSTFPVCAFTSKAQCAHPIPVTLRQPLALIENALAPLLVHSQLRLRDC
jgi:hypothetical protein